LVSSVSCSATTPAASSWVIAVLVVVDAAVVGAVDVVVAAAVVVAVDVAVAAAVVVKASVGNHTISV
jgi:hypothetical protein